MKKRLFACLAAALLLCLCLSSAFAAAWFTEPDTAMLHRDPFCINIRLGTALHAPTIWFDSIDAIYQQGDHLLCTTCAGAFPDAQPPAPAKTLYYNPEGGKYWHTDQNCHTIKDAYLPLSGEMPAADAEHSGLRPCPICNAIQPQNLQNAMQVWNATLEEKAAVLPGVWTSPSANALSPEEAWARATAFIEGSAAIMGHFPSGVYTDCIYHYDTAGDPQLAREHYRVLVTTPLQEPVAIIYVDALTGEIYSVTKVEHVAE